MSEARDILLRVRDRIADPAHWCQGWFAKTATGGFTTHSAPDASQWCLVGAIRKETQGRIMVQREISDAFKEYPDQVLILPDLNDEHSHEEVLAEIDKAIERLS